MKIKNSVIASFNRVGIDYQSLEKLSGKVETQNRFSGVTCEVSPLIAHLIAWVYSTSNDYEAGIQDVNISDFDRVRYFILAEDKNAYYTCID